MGNIKKVSFSYLFHIQEGFSIGYKTVTVFHRGLWKKDFSYSQKITYFTTLAESVIKSNGKRVRD